MLVAGVFKSSTQCSKNIKQNAVLGTCNAKDLAIIYSFEGVATGEGFNKPATK